MIAYFVSGAVHASATASTGAGGMVSILLFVAWESFLFWLLVKVLKRQA